MTNLKWCCQANIVYGEETKSIIPTSQVLLHLLGVCIPFTCARQLTEIHGAMPMACFQPFEAKPSNSSTWKSSWKGILLGLKPKNHLNAPSGTCPPLKSTSRPLRRTKSPKCYPKCARCFPNWPQGSQRSVKSSKHLSTSTMVYTTCAVSSLSFPKCISCTLS